MGFKFEGENKQFRFIQPWLFFLLTKFNEKFGQNKIIITFALPYPDRYRDVHYIILLSHGVMVAHLILVQTVQVRVLVGQLIKQKA